MKNIFYILLLLPTIIFAQYPSNGNQKITLGEQTTADGLIYRGVAADTTLTAKSDTAAYFVLDTVNINLYTYKASATGRKWRQLGADTASIAYVNTYGDQTVNGAKTFSSTVTGARFDPTSSSATGNGMFLPSTNSLGFSTAGLNRMTINSVGSVGIGTSPGNFSGLSFANPFFDVAGNMQLKGTTANGNSNLSMGGSTFRKAGIFTSIDGQSPYLSFYVASNYNSSIVSLLMYGDSLQRLGIGTLIPTEKLHVNGNARITAMNGINDIGASATGVLQAATSDMNLKNTIENSPFGLNEILLLNPVTFLYNDTDRKIDSDVKEVGFIAQDVFDIIPNAISSTGTGDLQLDYRAITATLVKAIQEQQAQIDALKHRLLILENK